MMKRNNKRKNKGRKDKKKKSTQSTARPTLALPDLTTLRMVSDNTILADKSFEFELVPVNINNSATESGPTDRQSDNFQQPPLTIQDQEGIQYVPKDGRLLRIRAPISLHAIAVGFFESPWVKHLAVLLRKETDLDLDTYLPYAWSMMAYVLLENNIPMASVRHAFLTQVTSGTVKILSDLIYEMARRFSTFGTGSPWQDLDTWAYCWLAAETTLTRLLPCLSSNRTRHGLVRRRLPESARCNILSLFRSSPESICSFVDATGLLDTLVLISLHMQDNECPGSQIDGLRSLHMIQKYCCGAHLAFVLHRKTVAMIVTAMENHLLNTSLQILGCKLLEHLLDPDTSPVYQEAWPVVKEAGGQGAASNTFMKHQENDEVNHAVFCVFFHLLPLPTEMYDVD